MVSFVRELRGSDSILDCAMVDRSGKLIARCVMVVAHVDRATKARGDDGAVLRATTGVGFYRGHSRITVVLLAVTCGG